MKKIIFLIIGVLIIGGGAWYTGFHLGKEEGYHSGYSFGFSEADHQCQNRSVEQLKDQIKSIEEKDPYAYLSGKGRIRRINEGSFFSPRYVNYFKGHISNEATMATFKDVALLVQFFAASGEKVGEQEIVVHEFVTPKGQANFEEKLNVTSEIEEFKFSIVKVEPYSAQ
ncbi:MAG: hypothetical protein V2I33_26220 [Kangiellaceae bacterium]|jgi:hypothetical protein|nr:hypothetical protein [Kangiellaceae bacterium]